MVKNKNSLGRTLIKNSKSGDRRRNADSSQHTTDLPDGYDWARLNLKSVTEQDTLEEFLNTAELAGTEFVAERQNIKIVDANVVLGLLSNEEKQAIEDAQKENQYLLSVPRRPPWDASTTPEELNAQEKESFLNWRRRLAELQSKEHIVLTPFEKNLEFWRQLWRVIERSDVVVQIVDARNPLLFRCEDLEKYVKEVSNHKENVILLNKSDFLTYEQRKLWAEYFAKAGLKVVFFSALQQTTQPQEPKVSSSEKSQVDDDEDEEEEKDDCTSKEQANEYEGKHPFKDVNSSEGGEQKEDQTLEKEQPISKVMCDSRTSQSQEVDNRQDALSSTEESVDITNTVSKEDSSSEDNQMTVISSPELLSREELLNFFKDVHRRSKVKEGMTVIGLVGYPNVGKSSTINALLQCKKVSVSATPGKTKHFQTIILDPQLCLCDCPGLVFPNFVSTKAEMIINGILPIDEMTEYKSPVSLVTERIPRHILESTYGIMLPLPHESEKASRNPTAEELLNAYGYSRGFMTHRGLPDTARSSRYILKDFVSGKLLYCQAPPDIPQSSYHMYPERVSSAPVNYDSHIQNRIHRNEKTTSKDIDKAFFRQVHSQVHVKHINGISSYIRKTDSIGETEASLSNLSISGKPRKKHHNRNKREKLRRVYSHLDH